MLGLANYQVAHLAGCWIRSAPCLQFVSETISECVTNCLFKELAFCFIMGSSFTVAM